MQKMALVAVISMAAGLAIAFAPTFFTDLTLTRPLSGNSKDNGLQGIAQVIDGDTIHIHGTRVRLNGIDAPESGQNCRTANGAAYPCGAKAGIYLKDLTGLALLRCEGNETDRYGRLIATCFLGNQDINAEMVHAGWAVAYRRYTGKYALAENDAKSAGLGLWQGSFQMPWDWRKERRVAAASTTNSARNCNIKGNISKNGRIYHVPGSRWYSKTQINENMGERWFCSEPEALAAGWHSPRYN